MSDIRIKDGRAIYPPHWLPDCPASFTALDNMIHKTNWIWLYNWWYRRSWSKIYSFHGVLLNHLGYQMCYEILKRGSMDYRKFTMLLYLGYKRIKKEMGINTRIPFMWGWPEMWSPYELATMRVFVIG